MDNQNNSEQTKKRKTFFHIVRLFFYSLGSFCFGLATFSFGGAFIPMAINTIAELITPTNEYIKVFSLLFAPMAIILLMLFVGIPFVLTIIFIILLIRECKKK